MSTTEVVDLSDGWALVVLPAGAVSPMDGHGGNECLNHIAAIAECL